LITIPPPGIPSTIKNIPKDEFLVKVFRGGTLKKIPQEKSTRVVPQHKTIDYPRILAYKASNDWIYRENVNLPVKNKQRPKRIKYILQHSKHGRWYLETLFKNSKIRRKSYETTQKLSYCKNSNIKIEGVILIVKNPKILEKLTEDFSPVDISITTILKEIG